VRVPSCPGRTPSAQDLMQSDKVGGRCDSGSSRLDYDYKKFIDFTSRFTHVGSSTNIIESSLQPLVQLRKYSNLQNYSLAFGIL
jgi:hypothetical protein